MRPPRRKLAARELLERAERGPSIDFVFSALPKEYRKLAEDHVKEHYRIWSQTWIIPQIKMLVPELREDKTK